MKPSECGFCLFVTKSAMGLDKYYCSERRGLHFPETLSHWGQLLLLEGCSCFFKTAPTSLGLLLFLEDCFHFFRTALVPWVLFLLLKNCSCFLRAVPAPWGLLLLLEGCSYSFRAAPASWGVIMRLEGSYLYALYGCSMNTVYSSDKPIYKHICT